MQHGWLELSLVGPDGPLTETPSGHVLGTPGLVYRLRLRNLHAHQSGLCTVALDGNTVTEDGLVLRPNQTVLLERPLTAGEVGCFTIFGEGHTGVFGEDGGRENPDLGLVRATLQLEAPRPVGPWILGSRPEPVYPLPYYPSHPPASPWVGPLRGPWLQPGVLFNSNAVNSTPVREMSFCALRSSAAEDTFSDSAVMRSSTMPEPGVANNVASRAARPPRQCQAAGTGLTGRSAQVFHPAALGPLATHVDVLELRIVLGGTMPDLTTPRPLPKRRAQPKRPEPRA